MTESDPKPRTEPISPTWMASANNISDAQWAGDDLVYLERRSDKTNLVRWNPLSGSADLTYCHSIRGGIFYGGGEFNCSRDHVFFVEKDGSVWMQSVNGGEPARLTTPKGKAASPVPSPDGRWCVVVRSFNDVDTLELINLQNLEGPCTTLVKGADFYMLPVWHPNSRQLAWIEWNQPQMPWQGTALMLADFDPQTGEISSPRRIDGSETVPVLQPEFSPDGKWLSYLANRSEWDDLMLYDLTTGESRVLYTGKSLLVPAWVLGIRQYGWMPDSSAINGIESEGGVSRLFHANLGTGKTTIGEIPGYTSLSQISIHPKDGRISLLASSADQPTQLIIWIGGKVTPIRLTYPLTVSTTSLPEVRSVSWQTKSGLVHGLYYSPKADRSEQTKARPTILHVHSGPTSQASAGFSADFAFYTSRGYAVLAVNYRGSTGFGRTYLQALDGHWGEVDVEDALSAVDFLVREGLATSDQIVIKGSSAGGYTVLNTLIRHPGAFNGAICAYPVGDLTTIVDDTFKYEARYYDTLIGPLPQDAKKYREWSPLQYADRIKDPIILFHGEDDPVIPFTQTQRIVEILQKTGTPHEFHLYQGEGHGWRKSQTLEDYYQSIELFLKKYISGESA